jgi:hypothetical protein
MAVQQLTQPIVNPISAFDATRAHNITFTVIGGAQVVANRLVISNNETGAIVYNKTAITMKLEHTIPANTLTNGGYYNAVVYTIDNANNESVASTAVPFYCYSQPVLTIDNIPATETIENGTYTFTGTYIQQEGEILNSYQYTLYDSNKNVLSKTPLIYYETDSSLSYTFVGMSNDTSYYIELSGETVNGTHITSGVIYFTVRYIQPASFAICDLVNNCDDGYIQVSSNIVAIDGKSNPDPPIYIDDKEVDLRDPDSWVEWDSGFRIQDDFTLRAWGRDFNPYEPIITLKNDIDTPQTPNKIEMKWMTGDVIKNLPLYTSKSGNNINITDSEVSNIQNLTIGGNSISNNGVFYSVGDIKNIINVQDFNITYNQAYYQDTNTNFKLQPNYLYTLSFDYNINSESTDLYFSIGYGVDNYETNIASSIQYKTQNKGRNTISFIVPEEVSDNDTLWVRFAQTIILANVNVDISNIQLEYGKKATDYQTPGLYNIYLTSAAKNLYNYETPLYIQRNNVSYTEIQGGYEITPVIVDTPASLNIGWKSLLNPGDTYTVSYSQLGQFEDFKLYKTDKNSQKIISEIPLDNNTFVAPDGFYDLQLAFSVDSSSTTNHIDIWNIQIEASNVITTYDPYISNSSIITLEEPLRSSDEYRDLICLASPNLLNPTNQSAKVSGGKEYYLSQAGSVSYTVDFINEDNNKISSTALTSGVFTTPDNCVKVQIENVGATDLTNNKVQINIGETARVYYPYVTVPSLIRYCKEENGVISVLDTPVAYDLSTDNQSALEVLTTYTPISNVFTNNTVLGQLYLDYVSGYSNQQTENAYVLLKCWNANKMPYVIHSNYIDIPSDYNKVFIWCRRKGNLFDLKIEDLGDYREHDKPIDTDKPVVELVVDKTGVTRTEIPVTATSIDNVGLRTVRFSKDNGATWDEIVPVDGLSSVNSYTFTGLTPDTIYTIRAEAIDLSGNIGGISENVTTLA